MKKEINFLFMIILSFSLSLLMPNQLHAERKLNPEELNTIRSNIRDISERLKFYTHASAETKKLLVGTLKSTFGDKLIQLFEIDTDAAQEVHSELNDLIYSTLIEFELQKDPQFLEAAAYFLNRIRPFASEKTQQIINSVLKNVDLKTDKETFLESLVRNTAYKWKNLDIEDRMAAAQRIQKELEFQKKKFSTPARSLQNSVNQAEKLIDGWLTFQREFAELVFEGIENQFTEVEGLNNKDYQYVQAGDVISAFYLMLLDSSQRHFGDELRSYIKDRVMKVASKAAVVLPGDVGEGVSIAAQNVAFKFEPRYSTCEVLFIDMDLNNNSLKN